MYDNGWYTIKLSTNGKINLLSEGAFIISAADYVYYWQLFQVP